MTHARCTLLAGTAFVALLSGPGRAEPPAEPFALIPTDLPGMSTGYLQPEATNEARIGTRQALGDDEVGTGVQLYDGAVSFRGYWPYQIGISAAAFDDPLSEPFEGNEQNFTLGSLGIDGKYSLYETARSAVAVEAGVTYLKYGFDGTEKEDLVAATLSLPATYRLSPTLFLNGEIGLTTFPDEAQDLPAPGARSFVALGAGWQPTDRVTVFGSAKAILREDDDGPEGDDNVIYTAGARYALTPQVAATGYVTNGLADTPVLDDLTYFPARDELVFGAALTYVPSGKRFNIPRYGETDVAAVDRAIVFGDGVTLMGPETIGSNELRLNLSAGTSGNSRLVAAISPDPDFQIEMFLEDYALDEDTDFRTEETEDIRYGFGARYQALSEAEGDFASLGARVILGRDIEEPTLGVLFGEAALAKEVAPRLELTANPKAAAFTGDEIYAFGLGAEYEISDRLHAVAEASVVSDDRDGIWAVGLRHTFPETLTAIDVYATNAAGRTGVGSMLAGETQIGASFIWQTPFRAF
ncbi:hypothetical protein SAMN04488020_11817 [Palleronia marisminoris]|uniref:Porin domain-containing protein n=1 Tax=Palleronia marisminoris TaxID=315423 RepID=A0A1Y5TSA7_9RHOB|nr:hypothetical protein [Palleronia marisminoris]SFH50004.1 hypothetical protein SAMN04488020_11817 [Palleronia marisminoris]SLN70275.1 hypothetical protein PAM7066_03560 [Palleronia marisminoris]